MFEALLGCDVALLKPSVWRTYIVGLGSNLGDAASNIRQAVEAVAALDGTELCGRSPIYRSVAVGPPQPDFLNAAIRLQSERGPLELLEELHRIEVALGRVRCIRWGARTIDLDILWADEPHCCSKLNIPHLRLTERWWALRPLLDVAPELGAIYREPLNNLGVNPEPLSCL